MHSIAVLSSALFYCVATVVSSQPGKVELSGVPLTAAVFWAIQKSKEDQPTPRGLVTLVQPNNEKDFHVALKVGASKPRFNEGHNGRLPMPLETQSFKVKKDADDPNRQLTQEGSIHGGKIEDIVQRELSHQDEDEAQCSAMADGSLTCRAEDYIGEGLDVDFICPASASTLSDCLTCAIVGADNAYQCISCTVCSSDTVVGYDCSNVAEGDCVVKDCNGKCASTGPEANVSPARAQTNTPTSSSSPATAIVCLVVAVIAAVGLAAFLLVRRRTTRIPRVTPRGGGNSSSSIVSDIYIEDVSKTSSSKRPRWLSHHLGSIKELTSDRNEGSSKIPVPASGEVDEESLFVDSLTERPITALGDADEESVGGISFSSITSGYSYSVANWSLPPAEESVGRNSFSSITSGYSYPAANWSLPPASAANEQSSYWTQDDDISVTEFEVRAPAGSLGVALETPGGREPRVHEINSHCPLAGRVRVGDRLVAVDGRNVTSWNATAISRLIASKKHNAVRELIFARPKETHRFT
jgi:hypothetical protein